MSKDLTEQNNRASEVLFRRQNDPPCGQRIMRFKERAFWQPATGNRQPAWQNSEATLIEARPSISQPLAFRCVILSSGNVLQEKDAHLARLR